MISWIRNKYRCYKNGHDWKYIDGVSEFTAFIIGNTYCKRCGKTAYARKEV